MTHRLLSVRINDMQPYHYSRSAGDANYLRALLKIALTGDVTAEYAPGTVADAYEIHPGLFDDWSFLVASRDIIIENGSERVALLPNYIKKVDLEKGSVTFAIPEDMNLNTIDRHGALRRLLGGEAMNAMRFGIRYDMAEPYSPSIPPITGRR